MKTFIIKAIDGESGEALSEVNFSQNWSKAISKKDILSCAINRVFAELEQKLIIEREIKYEI